MGTRFTNHTKWHLGYPVLLEGDHNGLGLIVEVIVEDIFASTRL